MMVDRTQRYLSFVVLNYMKVKSLKHKLLKTLTQNNLVPTQTKPSIITLVKNIIWKTSKPAAVVIPLRVVFARLGSPERTRI